MATRTDNIAADDRLDDGRANGSPSATIMMVHHLDGDQHTVGDLGSVGCDVTPIRLTECSVAASESGITWNPEHVHQNEIVFSATASCELLLKTLRVENAHKQRRQDITADSRGISAAQVIAIGERGFANQRHPLHVAGR